MAKTANLYARIEPDVKEQAESILTALGIPASNAINMFYKQIILQRGLPFEVKMPAVRPIDASVLTDVQMYAELEKRLKDLGIVNMLAGSAFCETEDEYLSHDSYEFHKHMGYEKVAQLKGIGKKFDRWYDLLWMQKKL